MTIVYLLAPLALLLAFGFVWACIWALSSGQFDDLETPSQRMLKDERFAKLVLKNKKEIVP